MKLNGVNLSERGQRVSQSLADVEVRRLMANHPEFFHGQDDEAGQPSGPAAEAARLISTYGADLGHSGSLT